MENGFGITAAKRILHVEHWTEATNAFIQELHEGTRASIEHAATFEAALSKIDQGHGAIDLVLYTADSATTDVLQFPERVRALASDGLFRSPHFILLAIGPLPQPCAAKCIDHQITYLLREYPKQIVETVRALLWKIRTSKPGPTIQVEFRQGHTRFYIWGTTIPEEIILAGQIGKLLLLLLGGVRTVEMVAETLDISQRTVKKYMRELRLILLSMLERMCMVDPTVEVVWMERRHGGTLCGIRANPVWN